MKGNEIVNFLIKEGLDAKLIVYPFAKNPYIRIGYWKPIPGKILSKIHTFVREEELHDEDCGDLYSYYLK